jgi:hypothetical protein
VRSLFPVIFFLACAMQTDASPVRGVRGTFHPATHGHGTPGRRSCEGDREPLPDTLTYSLRAGAFPGTDASDVAVHVPLGFDASRRPGVVVYFHGWQGCVVAALGEGDSLCADGGDPRRGAALAAQVDAARVNALLVAVELRVDLPTGEPGQLAMPGGLRGLLRELFAEHLADPLGCTLEVEGLDRVVVIAHSGGYQAAASVLQFGDVPEITEVDLLDALYGAEETFSAWIRHGVGLFDPRLRGPMRFIDLYTCCGGTVERSRAMASVARDAAAAAGWRQAVYDDDGVDDLDERALAHSIVFKRVPRAHPELPRAYVQVLLESAGFARIADPE